MNWNPRHNYAAIFAEYCNGASLENLAEVFGVETDVLRRIANEQKWSVLASKVQEKAFALVKSNGDSAMVLGSTPDKIEARAMVIQENREKNYRLWCRLRDEAGEVIMALAERRLKFKKYWNNKGQIVEKEVDPTMNDRTALASYFQMIAMGTYQALGDKGVISGAKMDGIGDNPSAVPQITIVLPGAICAPREERQAQATISI